MCRRVRAFEIPARVQLNKRLERAGELLDTVEHLRDIGESGASMKVAARAIAWLLPLHIKMNDQRLPLTSSFRERYVARKSAEDEDKSSVASSTTKGREVEAVRDDSAQLLIVPIKGREGKKEVHLDDGGPDCKLALAVACSQMGCSEEDRGYYHSAVDYFLQALQLVCMVYYPMDHHLYCNREVLDQAIARATQETLEIRREVEDHMAEEEAKTDHGSHLTTVPMDAPNQGSYHHDPHEHHHHYGHPVGTAGTADFCHDDVAQCLSNLAGSLRLVNEYEISSGYAILARDMYCRLKNGKEEEPEITKIDHLLSLNLHDLRRPKLAFHHICLAEKNRKLYYKTNAHPDYVASMNVKALIEASLGEKETAEETFVENMRVRGKVYGTSDPGYSMSTNSWGFAVYARRSCT